MIALIVKSLLVAEVSSTVKVRSPSRLRAPAPVADIVAPLGLLFAR